MREKARINNVLHETAVIKPSELIRHEMMAVTRADIVLMRKADHDLKAAVYHVHVFSDSGRS